MGDIHFLKRIIVKIQNDGWKGLHSAAVRRAKYWSELFYMMLVLRNRLITHLFPFKKPAVLLLSYPRSGSSWVGAVLSYSNNLTYMFEPVTRPYQKYQAGYAMADLKDPEIYQRYLKYAREAFQGNVPRQLDSAEDLKQYSVFGRKFRHLLIKEVNPRAAYLYCEHFNPNILLLIRHPAAVALSFWVLGFVLYQ